MDELIQRLSLPGVELRFCYEAGPTGYPLCRHLRKHGYVCEVVAPSLIPKKASDRVKTNRRDSDQLARLFRPTTGPIRGSAPQQNHPRRERHPFVHALKNSVGEPAWPWRQKHPRRPGHRPGRWGVQRARPMMKEERAPRVPGPKEKRKRASRTSIHLRPAWARQAGLFNNA